MLEEATGKYTFIDFEYAGYNPIYCEFFFFFFLFWGGPSALRLPACMLHGTARIHTHTIHTRIHTVWKQRKHVFPCICVDVWCWHAVPCA